MAGRGIADNRRHLNDQGHRGREMINQAVERRLDDLFMELGIDVRHVPRLRAMDVDIEDIDDIDLRNHMHIQRRLNYRPAGPRRFQDPAYEIRRGQAFDKAMTHLHRQVGKADDYFAAFIRDFESDIKLINDYASDKLKQELYKCKVLWKKEDEDDGIMERVLEHFKDQKTGLLKALEEVVFSDQGDYRVRKRGNLESEKKQRIERLIQKVSMALSQIRELLEQIPDKFQACKDLSAELKLLKTIVNPDSDMNKSLFKTAAKDQGSYENEGGSNGFGDDGNVDARGQADDTDQGNRGGGW